MNKYTNIKKNFFKELFECLFRGTAMMQLIFFFIFPSLRQQFQIWMFQQTFRKIFKQILSCFLSSAIPVLQDIAIIASSWPWQAQTMISVWVPTVLPLSAITFHSYICQCPAISRYRTSEWMLTAPSYILPHFLLWLPDLAGSFYRHLPDMHQFPLGAVPFTRLCNLPLDYYKLLLFGFSPL